MEPHRNTFVYQVFHKNGILARKFNMLPDSTLHGESQYFYPDGRLFKSVYFQHGIQEGPTKTYFPNQQLESLVYYEDGWPHGQSFWYNKSGQLIREIKYVDGDIDGWVNDYYPEGELKSKYFYKSGKKHGAGFDYYPSGKLRRWLHFNLMEQTGFTLLFDKNGKAQRAFGDILIDLEVDKDLLSWKNELSIGIAVAVPPGFTGEVAMRRYQHGQTFIRRGLLSPEHNTWRYRTSKLKKKEYRFSVSAKIESPDSFLVNTKTQYFKVDLSGKTPQIYYE